MSISHGSVVRIFSVVLLGIVCVVAGLTSTAQANNGGWFSSSLAIDQQDDSIYSLSLTGRDCKIRDSVPVKGMGPIAACVTEGTKLRFAYTNTTIYISKGRDQNFYPLSISSDKYAVLSPDSDRVTVYRTISSYASTFAVYEDSSSRFTYSNGMYVFQASQPNFQYSQTPRFFTLPRISVDGRFAAYVGVSADSTKFAVKTVDLESGQTTTVGYVLDTAAYSRENYREIAVSDDGEYVAINTYVRAEDNGDLFRTVQIWRNRDCDVESSVACETRLATDDVPDIGIPSGLAFNDTATTLTFMNYKNNLQTSTPDYYRTTFSIEDIFRAKQLDYLALGDSFSSGEGDTKAKGNYYIDGTNVLGDALNPQEMCHVSSRSYPFLLRDRLMPGSEMRSVACSGAVVAQDYTGSEYGYKGQNYRLASVSDVIRSQMKREALDISFIPGRNKQISFVNKYQPKAVTITGGGNDAGFGAVISSCARPNNTCAEATSLLKISQLGWTILSQYDTLRELYRTIHSKSPKTKIYAVGYPQFVAGRDAVCAANVGLDEAERRLVREGVIMMNDVIEAAANAAGVKYIDIESSLGDAVLCGEAKTEYVTGIAVNGSWGQIKNKEFYSNESFHPDAMGHHIMARSMQSMLGDKSLLDYSYCYGSAATCPKNSPSPPLTKFFKVFDTAPLEWVRGIFAQTSIQPSVDSTLRITTNGIDVGPATVRMASTPRTLGVVEIGEDGVLDANFTVPSEVEPGIHTLYIDTLSPAGEPITLWQYITVYGRDGDLDGNGEDDSLQPCPFITGGLLDSDADRVDDRCDSKIEQVEGHIFDTPQASQKYTGEKPRSSNVATAAARNLLRSESEYAVKYLLANNGPSILSDGQESEGERPNGLAQTNNRKLETNQLSRETAVLIIVSAAAIVCIIAIIGLTYGKTHSKK